MKNRFMVFVLMSILLTAGCATSGGASVEQKRAAVEKMRSDVLSKLYADKPDVQQQIVNSAGYAVFDNANVNVIIASFGGGYGVAVNRQTGARTYMNMAEAGIGLGIGAKDFSIVMVFHTQQALARFIEHGWAFGGNADAAAKHKHQGGAVAAEVVVDDVTVYSLTETGLALQAVLKGTKFWVDNDLN
ncbi:hypothetical protein HG263_04950 [Pseudoalteromonas sp. JBTF-M23]|uniref:Ysc84 actin-binding domain-containing protein n=1 Tax=Pseudoalteromonas caenipelagi TaxID=2726988 RepID=A0A849VBC8_9GAMM|nr:YSC84-related protein [Pseudoalteromonas caenipelagi]NOU49883.1 hypothetical protein [Pseudoalteromonas caenipelagi]